MWQLLALPTANTKVAKSLNLVPVNKCDIKVIHTYTFAYVYKGGERFKVWGGGDEPLVLYESGGGAI